jgi:hypothetical protein
MLGKYQNTHAKKNHTSSSLRFEFHCSAASAEHNGALGHMLGEDLAVVETALTLSASEAMLMPFSAQGLNVLSNNSYTALSALWCASLCTLRLAIDAPCVPVLLNVRHAVVKRVTTLGAEEMAVVPVSTESDDVLTENRGLAVLTARGEQLMPIKMAKEPETLISVFSHGLAWFLVESLASGAAFDAIKPLLTEMVRLMADFHRL